MMSLDLPTGDEHGVSICEGHHAPAAPPHQTVAVRLQGGIGDHLLGMRVLPFIHRRWPDHAIVAYSDNGGMAPPMEITTLSPYVSTVTPVRRVTERAFKETFGLDTLHPADLDRMMSADKFIDAAGEVLFAAAARDLDTPIFEILAQRPALRASADARRAAAAFLHAHHQCLFVGMHLSKYGPETLARHRPVVVRFLRRLLEDPRVVVLNFFATCYDAASWPPAYRATRVQSTAAERMVIESLCDLDPRVLPCGNLPIATVVALLERCRYFIGVDNGIKHVAWALGLPHTLFKPEKPSIFEVIRWFPDVHRLLLFQCSDKELEAHVQSAISALAIDEGVAL